MFSGGGGGGEVTCDNTRKETDDWIFSVKFLYNALDSRSAVQFPKSIIWCPCVPTKVGFFLLGKSLGVRC